MNEIKTKGKGSQMPSTPQNTKPFLVLRIQVSLRESEFYSFGTITKKGPVITLPGWNLDEIVKQCDFKELMTKPVKMNSVTASGGDSLIFKFICLVLLFLSPFSNICC